MAEMIDNSEAQNAAVENSNGRGNGRAEAQSRVRITFTKEAYDYMDREARRHGWSPSDAVNYMLSELDDWRSGRRKFTERRRQTR